MPGMYGIGKIHLKFKPKPPKKFPFGALLFGMACFSYALVYLNSIQWSRHNIVIPFFRWSIFSYGLLGSLVGSREVRLEGPGSAVRVYKNTDGVSCVEAGSVSDAMFGQGYLHASNHLYSLEMRRRTALGRLAEVEGYHSLPSDRLARVLRLKQLAMEDIAAESEENVQLLRNYASGVNAFLSSRRLPSLSLLIAGVLNIQEWTPEDTLMLMRLDALISSSALSKAALNLTLHYGVGAEAAAELMVAMESTSASDIGSHYTNSEFGTERSLKSSLETAWTTMYTKSGSPLLATSLSTLVRSVRAFSYFIDVISARLLHRMADFPHGISMTFQRDQSFMLWEHRGLGFRSCSTGTITISPGLCSLTTTERRADWLRRTCGMKMESPWWQYTARVAIWRGVSWTPMWNLLPRHAP